MGHLFLSYFQTYLKYYYRGCFGVYLNRFYFPGCLEFVWVEKTHSTIYNGLLYNFSIEHNIHVELNEIFRFLIYFENFKIQIGSRKCYTHELLIKQIN